MPRSPPRSRSTRRSATSSPASTSWWRSRRRLKNVDNDYDSLATQWFIVSDLGLTAFSGNDGIHVFVNSLATTDAKNGIEVRLISRGNEVLATRKTDAGGHAQFEAGLASGEGGCCARACWRRPTRKGDYAFLSLKAPAFDLTDRGVAGRPAPNGLDAFVYAERGVYRSGETAYLTALLRDAQGAAALGVPLTLVVERPDGVEFKRARGAGPGPGRPRADAADRGLGADRHLARARLHRSEAAAGRRDDVPGRGLRARPDRVRSDLAEPAASRKQSPAKIDVAGRFLYGAPAADLDLEGEMTIAVAKERAGLCRLSVRPRRRGGRAVQAAARRPADDRRRRQGELHRQPRQAAGEHASARSQDRRAHGRARRPRRRAQAHAAGDGERQHDRRQAAVLRPLARRRRQRQLRCCRRRAGRHGGRAARPALRIAAHRHALSVLQARRRLEFRAGQDDDARRRRHDRHRARQAGAHLAAGEFRPLSARSRRRPIRTAR